MGFAPNKIGPLNHSRWLTRANRTLRLYMSEKEQSVNLIRIVTYILNVYASMWFRVKSHPLCTDGPHNLFYFITLSRNLPSVDKQIIEPVIQRNGFFAHPENILLAAIIDENNQIKEFAAETILHARKNIACSIQIRQFVVPRINFQAENYISMINLSEYEEDVCSPPVLSNFTEDDIRRGKT